MRKDVVSLAELRFTMHLPQPMTAEQFLRRHKGVSHRMLVRLKRLPNGICCNGRQIRTIDMVQFGDEIVLTDCEVPSALAPSAAAVPVLGETDSYIVYNKPAGMPVHPSQGHHGDTLGNVFAAQFPQLPFRPVYRLDSDTSGICLVAKSAYAAGQLQGSTRKTYLALVCGELSTGGTVDAPIGRAEGSVLCRCVRPEGKPAVTHYTPLRSDGTCTLLSLRLETGRTHQIRAHFKSIKHPLFNDPEYGGNEILKGTTFTKYKQFVQNCFTTCPRQALHAKTLGFEHPATGKWMDFNSEVPRDMQQLIEKWRNYVANREIEENQ